MTARITARAIDATAPAFGLAPDELIVDSFAGGGGASEGIRLALGIDPHIAINHDAEALAMHEANHPGSRHYREDVWKVDPVAACAGRPVGLMWLSPDCKHFSKAKGGTPVSKKIRGLAWVAVRWAAAVRPRLIILENVEEFVTWGPADSTTKRPCPRRKGQTFRKFIRRLQLLGYVVEWRELSAADYGAPTTRTRLFLVARCDGQPIRWPEPTHGPGRLPYRTAAECIDWTIPCPSIFLTTAEAKAYAKANGLARPPKRPLVVKTLRRVARGIWRFVLDNPRPFIVRTAHGDESPTARRWGAGEHALETPLPTVTASKDFALVAPLLVPRYGEDPHRNGGQGQAPRALAVDRPMPTIVPTGNGAQLVAAFLAKHYGGHEATGSALTAPVDTITGTDHHALVTTALASVAAGALADRREQVRAFLVAYYGAEKDGQRVDEPLRTITPRDRMGLVTVRGDDYVIADVGMRMLTPRERFRAQGFPDAYRVEDVRHDGKLLTLEALGRLVGNSVAPPLARALVAANVLGEGLERAPLQGDFFAAEAAD